MSDTIKAETHLYALWDQYTKGWKYSITETPMEVVGWVKVETKTIEFNHPRPDADWSATAIKLTREKQASIRAEAQAEINELDDHIQSMLALEHKVAT